MLQPFSPSSTYKFALSNAIISPAVLDDLLGQVQIDLDTLCDEVIQDGEFIGHSENMQILCPGKPERAHLKSRTQSGKYNLGPRLMGGGASPKCYDNLDNLKAKYDALFTATKENFRKCSPDFPKINIQIQLDFFRDTATKELDAVYSEES